MAQEKEEQKKVKVIIGEFVVIEFYNWHNKRVLLYVVKLFFTYSLTMI